MARCRIRDTWSIRETTEAEKQDDEEAGEEERALPPPGTKDRRVDISSIVTTPLNIRCSYVISKI